MPEMRTCPSCKATHNEPMFGDYCVGCGRDRDGFAKAALTGITANPTSDPQSDFTAIAIEAYQYADAMIKARIGR